MIGRDADVRRAALEHLQHRVEHAGRRAEPLTVAPAAAPAAVEVAEQLVGTVDEVDDHRGPRMAEFWRCVTAPSPVAATAGPFASR